MDLAILQKIAQELDELLPGRFITRIHQPLPREIALRTRGSSGPEIRLIISADPALGRIHITDLKIPNPPSPPRFCAFLRAHFQGSRIIRVESEPDDRVVRIIAQKGPEAARVERELILELLGRDSNIILVDRATGRIMDCLQHIPEKEGGLRAVLPNRTYASPPKREGRGRIQKEEPSISGKKPGITAGPNGKRSLTLHAGGDKDETFSSINLAADTFFKPLLKSALTEAFRNQLSAPLKTRIRALDRRTVKIQVDARRLKDFTDRQEEGELLKASLHKIKKGMTSIEVIDWQTGGTRTIALDPALGPVANMDRIFKKAAKGRRGEKKVQERLQRTAEEKRAFEDLLYFVQDAPDIETLELINAQIPKPKAALVESSPRPQHRTQKPESPLFYHFQTPDGREVLVGRSARGNDFLVRNKAQKGDLWFHTRDFPGAHVLLRAQTGHPVSEQDKDFAAGLAVHFSKARGKGKVEVIIADGGELERPKGALLGQVIVKRYETILSIEVEPGRSLLNSK
jgi:predicted ribosome quality control (RQC) complex YloA/Tae2 family protein